MLSEFCLFKHKFESLMKNIVINLLIVWDVLRPIMGLTIHIMIESFKSNILQFRNIEDIIELQSAYESKEMLTS